MKRSYAQNLVVLSAFMPYLESLTSWIRDEVHGYGSEPLQSAQSAFDRWKTACTAHGPHQIHLPV